MVDNRVTLKDSMIEAIVKMVEGNPGALHVSMEIVTMEEGIGFVHYLKLDDAGIYGPRIWMCYKDLCGSDINKLYDLIRNNHLKDAIKEKCNQDEMFGKEWQSYQTLS